MKFVIALIIVILVVVFYYYIHITTEINNLDFKVDIKSVNFSQFVLTDFSSTRSQILSNIQIDINNTGSLALSFTNLYIEVYYKDALIAKTSGNPNNALKVKINKYSKTVVKQEFIIYLNKNLTQFVQDLNNANTFLNFKVKVNWFGITISQEITSKIN